MRLSSSAPWLGVCLLLLGVAGCKVEQRPDAGRAEAASPRVLILGTTQEPDSLDPIRTETAGAREVLELLHRGLGSYDERWRFEPGLAKGPPAVQTSSAGTVLEFDLRPGHRWSDGRPLRAQDFVFGHQVRTDPTIPNQTLTAYRVIEGLEAPSPGRLRVRLAPGALPDHVFGLLIALPSHVARADAAKDGRLDRNPISNGPYALERWQSGDRIELIARPDWPSGPPWFDRIVFRFFPSEDGFEAALATGRIDALGEASGLSVGKAAELGRRLAATHVVERTESGVWLQVSIRHDDPLAGRLAVRRAMNLALDREALAKVVYEGEATPTGGLFPAAHPVGLRAPVPRDLEAARAALLADGFRLRGDHFFRAGRRLELEMNFATGSEASERAASFIAASLGEVPIAVRLKGVPLRVLLEKIADPSRAPLAMLAWRLPPDWDAAAVLGESGAKNYGAFRDPVIEASLRAAETATSASAWRTQLTRVDDRAAELVPVLSLVFRRSVSVRPKTLLGWRPTGTVTPVTWNAESWRWDRPNPGSTDRPLDAPGAEE